MSEAATKLPVKNETTSSQLPRTTDWRPFDTLRNQVDRLFRDFETSLFQGPFTRDLGEMFGSGFNFPLKPALDVVEKDSAFEVTAELPGLDTKAIQLKVMDGILTISGEKTEEKEEKAKDRYVSERKYGSFRRSFQLPGSVDPNKIEASYKDGILRVTLPKSQEAQKAEKVIPITAK